MGLANFASFQITNMFPPQYFIELLFNFLLLQKLKGRKSNKECIDVNCPTKLRENCHPEPGVTALDCYHRGCIYDPDSKGPVCFFPLPDDRCTSCECEHKLQCLVDDVTQASCEQVGCTWCEQAEGFKCAIIQIQPDKCIDCECPESLREDCLPDVDTAIDTCHKRGCIWCDSSKPICFLPRPGPKCASCNCPDALKHNCHPEEGATEEACKERGCTWCPNEDNSYTCIAVDVEGMTAIEQWSPCRQTCNYGYHWKVTEPCQLEHISQCLRYYEACDPLECEIKECDVVSESHRYNDESSCCKTSTEICGESFEGRIIGGDPSDPGQWPWTVKITMMNNNIICTGMVVADYWVLTAAHCSNPNYIEIPNHPVKYSVFQSFSHPDYSFPHHDIMLLRFSQKLSLTPICLPRTEEAPLGTKCVVAGYGFTSQDPYMLPNTLMHTEVFILPIESCSYLSPAVDANQHICAGWLEGGKDSCNGDSGGPLMCQRCSSCAWYVAGVVSGGAETCAQPAKPGLYTKVSQYEDWINELILTTRKPPLLGCNQQ